MVVHLDTYSLICLYLGLCVDPDVDHCVNSYRLHHVWNSCVLIDVKKTEGDLCSYRIHHCLNRFYRGEWFDDDRKT